MRRFQRLSELAGSHDAFVVDIWGVLHDGDRPYPAARECLEGLRSSGKPVVLLSNTPYRRDETVAHLASLGFPRDLYDDVVTAGEVARATLVARIADGSLALGTPYFYIGDEEGRGIVRDLPLVEVATPNQAAFFLGTGVLDDATLESVLALALERAFLCANPDTSVVDQRGRRLACAGAIARRYLERGGRVEYFGKPWPEIYRMALARWPEIAPESIAAIGDNPETDIAGALRCGLTAVLLLSGISGSLASHGNAREAREAGRENAPTAVLERFAW